MYFSTWEESPESYSKRTKAEKYTSYLTSSLYGSNSLLKDIQLCRWQLVNGQEKLPGDCTFEPHDVTILVRSPHEFAATPYLEIFKGASPRLHVCSTCKSDVVVDLTKDKPELELIGLRAIGVDLLARLNMAKELRQHVVVAKKKRASIKKLLGNTVFYSPGLKKGVNLSVGNQSMILVLNLAVLILFTLWLALKAHRKVLDYFSRNNALLPLVASCGSAKFYRALWIITVLRVCCFLLASVPLTILFYATEVPDRLYQHFIPSTYEFFTWLCALLGSMTCVTIISSIADLKKRHTWMSFLYTYGPATCCILGTAFWIGSIFSDHTTIAFIRSAIASLPVFGFVPVLASPVIKLDADILALHTLLSGAITLWLLQANSKWFARHVEEL